MPRHWWLTPLYWLLAAAPLAAAFWVFLNLPTAIYITPTVRLPLNRAGVWALPLLNICCAVFLYWQSGKIARQIEVRARSEERQTDILQVLPGIRVFFMALLSGMSGVVVYGYYHLDTGGITADLSGRVTALLLGAGVTIFALKLPHATKNNTLALRWTYTERSPQVWLKTHKLGTPILYLTGAIMVGTAFLMSGLWAAITAVFALFSALFGLYLYAKHLYESEFR